MINRTSQASQGDSPTDPIASLAAHAGIVGGRRGSVARLLSAMGFDVSSTRAAQATWRAVAEREAERWLGPVRVLRTGERALVLPVTPDSAGRYEIDVRLESGENLLRRGRVRGVPGGIEVRMPAHLPAGYHHLRVGLARAGASIEADCPLIVSPGRCVTPAEVHARRARGIWLNLYSLRSARNAGFGDLGDLRRLIAPVARHGGEFIGLNPLHAIRNTRRECSPYSPISRLFLSELYIDPQQAPEWRELPEAARSRLATPERIARLDRLRAADRIDHDAVRELKRAALRELFAVFVRRHRDADSARGRAWRRFLATHGQALRDHAVFMTLDAQFGRKPGGWQAWPLRYRDPRHPAVAEFAAQRRAEVELELWIQFELDRQLAQAAQRCRRAGMRLGLYRDLAIGSTAEGSDAWGNQAGFVFDASIGAPPDAFASTGQIWDLPPVHPLRLRERGYRDFIQLLRASFAHSGLLRIDHVIGLVRQFWIPRGLSGRDGAFVRYPAADLFAILALESQRHRAVVVGEDLGTVPDELRPLMQRHRVQRSSVLLFELNPAGLPEPKSLPKDALLTVVTHDHTPLCGFVAGSDIPLRRNLGLLTARVAKQLTSERRDQIRNLIDQLRKLRLLTNPDPTPAEIVAAIHTWLRRLPTALQALSLDDLGGETTPVNVPTATPDRYPVWSRRMRQPIEHLQANLPNLHP